MSQRPLSPERLTLARQLRGWTQLRLAEELDLSPAAISQFESGDARPASETVERISILLKVSPSFLGRSVEVRPRSTAFFRALGRTKAIERETAAAYARLVGEIGEALDRYVEMPPIRVEQLVQADDTTTDSDLELIAGRVRSVWGVPSGPIADMVNLGEAGGVLVTAVGSFAAGMDAFSMRTNKRPVVVLCTGKGIAARRRFDMAHELGHLVLHTHRDADQRRQEKQAHRFAAALLMPAEEVEPFLPRRAGDFTTLEVTAKTWGVSMQAALYRAKQLGVLSKTDYERTMRRMSAAGWRTREPVEIGPPERPRLLMRAVAALPHAGTSLGNVAELLGVPHGRLARMLALPEDYDDAQGNVVDLDGARTVLA